MADAANPAPGGEGSVQIPPAPNGSPPPAPTNGSPPPAGKASPAPAPAPAADKDKDKGKDVDLEEIDEENLSADDKRMLRMPVNRFMTRVKNASRKALMDVFGTDNREEIMQWKRNYEQYLKSEDERRKAQLSKEERLAEEKADAERAARRHELALERERDARVVDRIEGSVERALDRFIADGDVYRDGVVAQFKKHIRSIEKAEAAEYETDPKKIVAWFEKFATDNPTYARASAQAQGQPQAKPTPPVQPANTGSGAARPAPAASGALSGKTPKPGQPNSMTKAEFEEYKRQRGLSY